MGINLSPNQRPPRPSKFPKTSVRISLKEKAELELMAEILNAAEQAHESNAPPWNMTTLMEHLIREGMGDIWRQFGGRLETGEAREDFLRRALENLSKRAKPRRRPGH